MTHFDDVIMPTTVRFGSASIPTTDIQQVHKKSGFRKTNQRRTRQKLILRLIYLDSIQAISDIMKIWRAMVGPFHTFLCEDALDWNSTDGKMDFGDESLITAFDQPMKNTVTGGILGDGTTTIFQLAKSYAVGATASELREITKPISGTVKAGVNAVELTEGGSPDDFTVDHSTGLVTFANPPGAGESPTAVSVTGGYRYRLPVHFMEDEGFEQRLQTAKVNTVPAADLMEAFL